VRAAIAILLLAACGASYAPPEPRRPPPIDKGKCIADNYVNDTAMRQTCIYLGYSWECVWRSAGVDTCDRRGEATGERPK
jgi:hypothetical protein